MLLAAWRSSDCVDDPTPLDDMADYVVPEYSKSQIVKAGRALAGRIPSADDEALEVFRIAHNWRDSYVLPMLRIRQELAAKTRQVQRGAVTAARLKRMQSIRRKLNDTPLTLYQLQDIGGCRVILDSLGEVDALLHRYRDGGAIHQINKEISYIDSPKRDGYRSHHIIFKFRGRGDYTVYNRQTIELQIRTKLQHAWATAVEAVGLVRGENLKGGVGNEEWLRFFVVMSSEFAAEEGRPVVPATSENPEERRSELIDLEKRLDAIRNLENYNQIIQYTDYYVGHTRYFIVQYDYARKMVTVEPQQSFISGSRRYVEEEDKHSSRNTVLVEADKVDDLKAAFPNYFLDVKMFTNRLKDIIFDRKRSRQSPRRRPKLDLSWLRNYRRSRE